VTAHVIETFAALADPNRFRMVELLRSGPRTVNEISGRLSLNQPQVSKHLRTLREAGLVDVEPRAQKRHYELRAESLRQLQRWLDRYRQLWEARFDRLDALVEELKEQQTAKERKAHGRKRTP
jgi:DNA-binding transcriptional ArsR family regulator